MLEGMRDTIVSEHVEKLCVARDRGGRRTGVGFRLAEEIRIVRGE